MVNVLLFLLGLHCEKLPVQCTPFLCGKKNYCPISLQMLNSRENADNCSLLFASGLFTRRREWFRPSFAHIAVDFYNVTLQTVDFVGNPEGARVHINEWTSNSTAGNIRQLLDPASVSRRTVATFVNAVYFKALWRIPFDARRTRKGVFFISSTQQIEMETMTTEARFSFTRVDDLRCRMIELRYSTGDLSMYVLLPDDIGLSRLERRLDSARFDAAVRRMPPPRLVKLTMPKFSLTTTLSLMRTLTAMGVVDVFDGTAADLSGISDNDLYVSDFVHEMHVDVGEAGTEAAAASTAIIGLTSLPLPVPRFVVDKPFMVLVRERTTGAILFLGRLITSPKPDAEISTYADDGEDSSAASCISGGSFLALQVVSVLVLLRSFVSERLFCQ